MKQFRYSRDFDEKYAYEGKDLGALCKPQGTNFKLWAPFAERVELCLYGHGEREAKASCILDMEKGERGVWNQYLEGDYHGCYYDYQIWTDGEFCRTADPCAVGCGSNGYRSMITDLERTNPEGFEQDQAPARPSENIIYELHIKDFSHDVESGIPQAYRGKYKAFTVRDGKLNGSGQYPTCLAYLKELGITHVHLLPFFDYGWLDEEGDDEQFNWGYDPVNYNVPEGSYATDVRDGTVRIRECKEMIQALHQAGIRVIMDVVYNHTQDADSWLERTAPGYFCRRFQDGTLSNGSACGSDLAIGRRMVDNYIVNSVMYWAREYHLDGFRFDLMGLMTVELMNRIRRELDQEFGRGEKLMYGEPWRAADSPMEEETRAALKENIRYLDEEIAVFCDNTRDAIKGHVFYVEEPGFVNGGQDLEEKVLRAVTGWCGETFKDGSFHPRSCSQIVNYISAHDNFTLWDKLVLSLHGPEGDFARPYEDVLAANKLAALICFTCQGRLFLLYSVRQEAVLLPLPEGKWELLADGESSFRWQSPEVYSGTAPLAPMTAAIFGQRVEGVQVRRRCAVEYGANTAAVAYTIENRSSVPCTLRVRPFTPDAARTVREQLEPVEAMLREGCVGQIPEIYDGGTPGPSKGCFAQAWSVGELLRVYEQLENIEKEADSHAG